MALASLSKPFEQQLLLKVVQAASVPQVFHQPGNARVAKLKQVASADSLLCEPLTRGNKMQGQRLPVEYALQRRWLANGCKRRAGENHDHAERRARYAWCRCD